MDTRGALNIISLQLTQLKDRQEAAGNTADLVTSIEEQLRELERRIVESRRQSRSALQRVFRRDLAPSLSSAPPSPPVLSSPSAGLPLPAAPASRSSLRHVFRRDPAPSLPPSPPLSSAEQEQLRLCLEQINLLYTRLSYEALRNNHQTNLLHDINQSSTTQLMEERAWRHKVDQYMDRLKAYLEIHSMQAEDLKDELDEDPSEASQPLKILHTISLRGLEILADALDDEKYMDLVSRLRTWGIGILHGPLSLDYIFAPNVETDLSSVYIGFRMLASLFIKMLLNIKYLIVILEMDSKEVELYLLELANTFDIPSIWGEVQALEEFKAQLKRETTEESVGACHQALRGEIESLYDMLPAIGTLRRIYASKASPERVQLPPAAALVEENAKLGDRIAESLRVTAKEKFREEKSKEEKSKEEKSKEEKSKEEKSKEEESKEEESKEEKFKEEKSKEENSEELNLAMRLSEESERLRELRIPESEQRMAAMATILSDRRRRLREFKNKLNAPSEEQPSTSSDVKGGSNTGPLGKEFAAFHSNDYMGRIEQILGPGPSKSS
ncbi:hypothetical protein GGR58DRAFT_499958 [Xylaria digitata]|nr:hypothetical protein GGR58DRAFT_499958 [Xylaria digitata]